MTLGPATSRARGQIFRDSASLNLIKDGVDKLYNFQFREAEKSFHKVSLYYPGHPANFILSALLKYWRNYPLLSSSQISNGFVTDLRVCIEMCEKEQHHGDNEEYLLVNMCARGMLLLFYSDNGMSKEVLRLATTTYPFIRDALNKTSEYADFYLFTGLYNYYREAYPEAYPIYKALAFLFPRGDKKKGLEQLKMAGQNSIVLRAEAYSFLSWILTNFENDYSRSTETIKILYESYPINPQYKIAYIKNLLLLKKYDEAEQVMNSSGDGHGSLFYSAQLQICKGILQEKKYFNNKIAIQNYERGLRDIASFPNYSNEYSAYAYFGLSRITDRKKENDRKEYRKKALNIFPFKNVTFD